MLNPILNTGPVNTGIILIVILSLVLVIFSPTFTAQVYKILRVAYKYYVFYSTQHFTESTSPNVIYRSDSVDPFSMALVEKESEKMIAAVNDFFDFKQDKPFPVIVYPTMEALNASFGWDGDRSPMGVYWMGVIKILAPEAWIPEEGALREFIFESMGPMAHEYTHLVIDYKTNGNYPRWFSEGVAQYVEQTLDCYTTDEPDFLAKREIYSFNDLNDHFDEKNDQNLAYWQSLMAIHYLVDHYSQDIINKILAQLAQGKRFDKILKNLTGENLNQLTQNVQRYVLEMDYPIAI